MREKSKPLSFSTTIRNPERIPDFLQVIKPFEGNILTSDIIHDVVKGVIKSGCYTPMCISRSPELKAMVNSGETFTDAQLETIIASSPQKHKEANFTAVWDSRFDTWYKMMKEFGFIKYAMEKPIVITQTGHLLLDASAEGSRDDKKIQRVFLNALMKYQTNNPLRRNLNENAPLPLLLNVIKLLHEDKGENDAGVARHELPVLICYPNNDPRAVYEYIKNIRKEVGFNCSDEYIYEKCLSLLGSGNRKYLKMEKICREAVDEYIRKMRMTGLLSLRGNGRFLDINKFEEKSAQYVADNYLQYKKYSTEDDYIDYMGTIDTKILHIEAAVSSESSEVKKRTLKRYVMNMTREAVFDELKAVCAKKESRDAVLKYIAAPTRFEFLSSVALVQAFKTLDVNPNYAVDNEGMPTFTASGGAADIECFDTDYDSYFEVTLMCGRSEQVNNEIIPISRHLQEAKKTQREQSFAVLVAPAIHADTVEAADWQKIKHGADIVPQDIALFTAGLRSYDKASEFLTNAIRDAE